MRPLLVVACVLLPIPLAAAEPAEVDVRLMDGRRVFGVVDQQTDSNTLWIRSAEPGIFLRSGHSWQMVSHVRHGKSLLTGESMITATLALRTAVESPLVDSRISPSARRPASAAQDDRARQIRSLRVDAVHANWDRDAETDGLRVIISPLNMNSDIVAVDGIVEVELLAEHFSPTRASQRFERLGRWTRSVRTTEFDVDGVSLNLPYQQFRAERDLDVLNDGLVHVRFKVPGVGSFESTDPWVRLRPSSPMLNRYQLHTGQRSRAFGQPSNPIRLRPIQRY